ncbi:uncharacterized protein KNAG_0F02990 [Huiozyma naganishii CBS 8797]|uniref:Uncharacterized protein n=1 Tax=Huiozyma naganishii (strain ATCC MYA-139 / BCRC 22969 / CBS 8797 / KCTC 17520 / NBRC 10181 / NCYC 3082 / Yp74L-3) TaxID=1071383 RepID=J7S8L3_HUIN7|nr:hypothetical protein KNAG_0F02990 [Kazachstania naganishii CBS 8797]CCK70961.1 hypothetical protein KNAG_0F02990 [Kazachstania naganishii CBS 8797]
MGVSHTLPQNNAHVNRVQAVSFFSRDKGCVHALHKCSATQSAPHGTVSRTRAPHTAAPQQQEKVAARSVCLSVSGASGRDPLCAGGKRGSGGRRPGRRPSRLAAPSQWGNTQQRALMQQRQGSGRETAVCVLAFVAVTPPSTASCPASGEFLLHAARGRCGEVRTGRTRGAGLSWARRGEVVSSTLKLRIYGLLLLRCCCYFLCSLGVPPFWALAASSSLSPAHQLIDFNWCLTQ